MDLYALLGVARDASLDDIERAYRRLARRYHPGINPGDRVAEEMYAGIQRAYEVLADRDRRRDYDRGGRRPPPVQMEAAVAFEGFDFTAVTPDSAAATFSELFADVFQQAAQERATPTRGADLEVRAAVSFDQAIRGGESPLSIVRQERCPHCGGDGVVARLPVTCPACGGVGERRWARGHMTFSKPCEVCGGRGRLAEQGCLPCAGVGTLARSEVVTVPTPPGLASGMRLVVPGRGHAGARGGPAGDLYVQFDVSEHPLFARDGRDLEVVVPIAAHEAALGAKVELPTLDGLRTLRVPPGTSSGQRLRVRGGGVPGVGDQPPGDLYAKIQVTVSAPRDEAERELWRQLARFESADPRAHFREQ